MEPPAAWMRTYRREMLRGDVVAGVTVTAYLIPQVLAYAELAGLPPVAGLWAALPALLLYALLGSSRNLSVGPESTTALMTATVVAPLAAGDPRRYAVLAGTLAVVVGLLALAAWLLRLGFLADLLSRPILLGYMAGVAVIMVAGQLEKGTGVPVEGDSVLAELASFVAGLGAVRIPTLTLTLASLAFLFAVRWRFPGAPGPLLVVALGAVAVAVLDLEDRGIALVGEIPGGVPGAQLPALGELAALVVPALGVFVVGYSDNVLTARAFASRDGGRIDANRELLALGAANVGAGTLSGFPVSSSGSRTALVASAGGRSQLHSLVALVAIVVVLLVARPALASFPQAALAALVIYAATRLVDIAGLRRLAAFRRSELLLAVAAFAGVLVFDILVGVLVAIGMSVIELLARVARPHDAVLGSVPGLAGMHDVEDYPEATTIPGLVVYRYDSPLFFANAQDFARRALDAVDDETQPVEWVVLNMEANVEVDITAMEALEELRRELTGRGITVALARVKQDLRDELDAFGFTATVGENLIFPTLPTAVDAFRHRHEARPGAGPEQGT